MFADLAAPVSSGHPIRLLAPGNISAAKGEKILDYLAQIAPQETLEVHILGKIGQNPKIVFHGSYDREDFADKVGVIKPHLGVVFSIWPETYCHTLTEMWSCGLPVLGFDLVRSASVYVIPGLDGLYHMAMLMRCIIK